MLVGVHGPPLEEVAERHSLPSGEVVLQNKNDILPSVLRAYNVKRRSRRFRQQQKRRRDCGLQSDPDELGAKRIRRGAPQPEAELLREREKFIRRRLAKKQSSNSVRSVLGGPIPARDVKTMQLLSTPHMIKLREIASSMSHAASSHNKLLDAKAKPTTVCKGAYGR